MEGCYTIEIEPEVRLWLSNISDRQYIMTERHVDRLAESPATLGEPYSRHLGGKLRELRFDLDSKAIRISYWLAPGRRIVLLTVFRKTRMRESSEVDRARRAQMLCETTHRVADEHETYSRDVKG